MSGKKRVFVLIQVMLITYALSIGMAVVLLYRAEIERARLQLVATAQSQARLIEAMARFDADQSSDYPGGSLAATLSQITDAHEKYEGFGRTGEFTLARQVGNEIVFQFSHRHDGLDVPIPIPLDSKFAEPMRRALKGDSGTLIGLDYRGVKVVAAYEPVDLAGMGIVAKIDLAEVRAPFIRVASVASGVAVILVLCCWFLFLRVSDPMLKKLENHARCLQEEVDQRALVERELSRSEAKYRAVVEDIPVMICRFLAGGEITYINRAYRKSIGKTEAELIGTSFFPLIPECDRKYVVASIASLNQDTPTKTIDHRIVAAGGAVTWQRWTNRALFDAEGGIVAYQSLGEDITERKRAELERDRLFAAVEQLDETVFITDPEGTIVYANPAMERNTGYSLDELIGRNPRILKSKRHNAEFYASLWKTITSGENWSSHLTGKRKDGAEYEVDVTITPVFAGGEIVNYVSVQHDVTREAQLQAEVRQALKMEAVGLLAGGIAHDFNNMLSVIIGHSDIALAKPRSSGNEAILKSFRAIRDAALRSATLTRQLFSLLSQAGHPARRLRFARKRAGHPENASAAPRGGCRHRYDDRAQSVAYQIRSGASGPGPCQSCRQCQGRHAFGGQADYQDRKHGAPGDRERGRPES